MREAGADGVGPLVRSFGWAQETLLDSDVEAGGLTRARTNKTLTRHAFVAGEARVACLTLSYDTPDAAKIRKKEMLESHEQDRAFFDGDAGQSFLSRGWLILPDLETRYNYRGDEILGPKPDYGYLIPSLDDSELCEKDYRECILLGRKPPASEWDVTHVVVMLITRVSGIAHRLGIADMAEDFWSQADRKWELIALD